MPNIQLTPEELAQEAQRILAQDQTRLSSLNYPVYRGQTVSPMSAATQRARQLRDEALSRRSPYDQRIQTVLSRNNQGLTGNNIQNILNTITQGQQGLNQNMVNTLRENLGSGFEQHIPRFNERVNQTLETTRPTFAASLENLARVSNDLEANRNRQIVNTLQGLRQNAQNRRQTLTGNLEQVGNQRHAYNNMVNAANEAQFRNEVGAPQNRMRRLAEALQNYNAIGGENAHPDIARAQGTNLLQALRAYGIDVSRPVSEWQNSIRPTPSYQGRLVADLPSEIQASSDILERLNPNLQDANTERRRQITRGLVETPNLSETVLQNLPEAVRGNIAQLDTDARQRLQRELRALNNRYIRFGQFGSSQHLGEAEETASDLNRAIVEQRNRIIQNALQEQLNLGHQNEINNLRQLNTIGQESHSNFNDIINNLRNLNQQGATRFANDQEENERLYRNYQNESLWQWPHLRNMIRGEGIQQGLNQGLQQGRYGALGEVFQGLADRNISLDNLANLNTRYNEMERESTQLQGRYNDIQRENAQLRGQITSLEAARNALRTAVPAAAPAPVAARGPVPAPAPARGPVPAPAPAPIPAGPPPAEIARIAAQRARAESERLQQLRRMQILAERDREIARIEQLNNEAWAARQAAVAAAGPRATAWRQINGGHRVEELVDPAALRAQEEFNRLSSQLSTLRARRNDRTT